MFYIKLTFLIILCTGLRLCTLSAQSIDGNPLPQIISGLERMNTDSSRVALLLVRGQQYLLRIGSIPSDMDSARYFAFQAREYSRYAGYAQGYSDATALLAQVSLDEDKIGDVLAMIDKEGPREISIRLLLLLGIHYLERGGSLPRDMDSAARYIRQAQQRSQQLQSAQWMDESLRTMGRYYLENGNIAEGKEYFQRAIDDLHEKGRLYDEANFRVDLGYRIPDNDSSFNEKIDNLTRALTLFHQIGRKDKEIWVRRARAEIYRRQGRLDQAEKELLTVIDLQRSAGLTNLHETYNILTRVSQFKGDYSKALQYCLESVKSMTATHDTIYAGYVYEQLGNLYDQLTQPIKSQEWYNRAAQFFIGAGDIEPTFRINALLAQGLINLNQPGPALTLLQQTEKNYPTKEPLNHQLIAGVYASAWQALHLYDQAETWYRQMLSWEQRLRTGNELSANTYFLAGRFYLETGKYTKAAVYLDTALIYAPGRVPIPRLKDIHLLLFKADSALDNYTAAISHLQSFQRLNDSIFNAQRNRQFEELQIQYETSQKEKDILALRDQAAAQTKEINQAAQLRRFTYATILLLLLLLILGYNRYRIKQHNSRRMAAKQKEITEKNDSLRQLVKEKEWLVREIHHRVKNNLQIIMSLLSAQSDYLENETALKAISESRQRMQAISLIHQKLYLPGNPETVEMQVYIRELVSYLKEGFAHIERIWFDLRIAPVRLKASQAVAVGLILNEAVTNSMKYAFPDNKKGSITVTLEYADAGYLLLTISDTGQGLPVNIDFGQSNSLGIRLIETFSKQLEGRLTVDKTNGLSIRLIFQHQQ